MSDRAAVPQRLRAVRIRVDDVQDLAAYVALSGSDSGRWVTVGGWLEVRSCRRSRCVVAAQMPIRSK